MVAVIDKKLVFSRDQVLTSTQASKNFGEARRRARHEPQFVSDRNSGIDTVIVDFDEFEAMVVELEELREERLYAIAAQRLATYEKGDNAPVPFEGVICEDAFAKLVDEEAASDASDEDLFE
jgi:PHD/YefM family antitoxin component YafN of YafNO toxin-antitoxin module